MSVVEPAKRATNLSLSADVLQAARDLGMNLSQTVDALLAREVKRLTIARWAAEHPQALERYNRRVVDAGLFNADLRRLHGPF